MVQGMYPQNMAKNMVRTYLHFRILEFILIFAGLLALIGPFSLLWPAVILRNTPFLLVQTWLKPHVTNGQLLHKLYVPWLNPPLPLKSHIFRNASAQSLAHDMSSAKILGDAKDAVGATNQNSLKRQGILEIFTGDLYGFMGKIKDYYSHQYTMNSSRKIKSWTWHSHVDLLDPSTNDLRFSIKY